MRAIGLLLAILSACAAAAAAEEDPRALLAAQAGREACWSFSQAAMMVALDVHELGAKETRRIHVDENRHAASAKAAAETLAALEKDPGIDPIAFTANRHVDCLAQQAPRIVYAKPALNDCFFYSASLQIIADTRDSGVSMNDVLARVRETPVAPGYKGKLAERETIVREIFGQNPVATIRYMYGQFLACLLDHYGTDGDPQIEAIARSVWMQQCWNSGQLAQDIGSDWLSKHDAKALTARFNKDGAQAEAAGMIDEISQAKFEKGEEYAASRFARCLTTIPVKAPAQPETRVAPCFATMRLHRIVAAGRLSGVPKEEAQKAVAAMLKQEQAPEAVVARGAKAVDWVYTDAPELIDARMFALFRACITP